MTSEIYFAQDDKRDLLQNTGLFLKFTTKMRTIATIDIKISSGVVIIRRAIRDKRGKPDMSQPTHHHPVDRFQANSSKNHKRTNHKRRMA
jgi:hypothetical protein